MNRPNIKDFFSEDTTPQIINNTFLENKELYNYIQAQDNYIDNLSNRLEKLSYIEAVPQADAVAEDYNKGIDDCCAIYSNTISFCMQEYQIIVKRKIWHKKPQYTLTELKIIYDILQKTKNDIMTLKKATTSL